MPADKGVGHRLGDAVVGRGSAAPVLSPSTGAGMGYLDGMEPRLRKALELRKLSLHERADRRGYFDVYWDDGIKSAPDDRGLPVGFLNVSAHSSGFTRRRVELWWVSVSSPVVHEVAARLPDINEAISVLLVHLPDRYS
ncbi:hypothetical protein ACIQ6Y_33445 [Streptomyces sp. NPDC096205]|uniref:hypothetical protein n=1 Tax=Streptomyces sp. NPDC096205 TaxID=3366081 RepID=UPI003823A1B0